MTPQQTIAHYASPPSSAEGGRDELYRATDTNIDSQARLRAGSLRIDSCWSHPFSIANQSEGPETGFWEA
jgi:hypothetical protein